MEQQNCDHDYESEMTDKELELLSQYLDFLMNESRENPEILYDSNSIDDVEIDKLLER